MHQLGFQFDPIPAPPTAGEPKWFKTKLDKTGASYIEIGVMQNPDGTWAVSTGDNLLGWCGHGGPFYGSHSSFTDALAHAIGIQRRSYRWKAEDNHDSVQNDRHRAMGRAGLKWLEDLAAEYSIDTRNDA